MPGGPPGRRHAIQGDRLVEGDRLHQLQSRLSVSHSVEREGLTVPAVAAFVGVSGILLLQMSRIRQHQLQQGTRGFGGEHWPPKSLRRQARQITDVIDVGMRQQDRVEPVRWCGEGLPVLLLHPAPTLE